MQAIVVTPAHPRQHRRERWTSSPLRRRRHQQHGTHRQGRPGLLWGRMPAAMRQTWPPPSPPNPTTGTCTHHALPDCALRLSTPSNTEGRDSEPPHHHPSPPRLPPPRQCPDLQVPALAPQAQTAGDYKPWSASSSSAAATGCMLVPRKPRPTPLTAASGAAWPTRWHGAVAQRRHTRRRALWPQLRPHGDCAAQGSGQAGGGGQCRAAGRPTTRAQVLAGSGSLPNLYSHSDQILQARANNCHRQRGHRMDPGAGRRPGGPVARQRFQPPSPHASSAPAPRWPRPALIPASTSRPMAPNVWPRQRRPGPAKGLAEGDPGPGVSPHQARQPRAPGRPDPQPAAALRRLCR